MTDSGGEYAVARVIYDYAHALDARDWDLFDACFEPDAAIEMSVAGRHPSPAHYRERAKEVLAALDVTHHLFGNPRIEIDGDRAHADCYYQAQHARNDLAPHPLLMIGGRVSAELTRRGGRWRIARWKGTALWVDGNPAVLGLPGPPGALTPGRG